MDASNASDESLAGGKARATTEDQSPCGLQVVRVRKARKHMANSYADADREQLTGLGLKRRHSQLQRWPWAVKAQSNNADTAVPVRTEHRPTVAADAGKC
jgi:hypothetical protein